MVDSTQLNIKEAPRVLAGSRKVSALSRLTTVSIRALTLVSQTFSTEQPRTSLPALKISDKSKHSTSKTKC